jgi:hypothetical protein
MAGSHGHSFADADRIIGDQHGKPLTWKGNADLGIEPGRPIIFRVRMDRASIYWLEFE